MRKFLLSLILFFTSYISLAQCTVTINNFPFREDFEASNGNWISGGVASDWKWGKPSKPVINAAASGAKCWMTGEFDKTGYAGGQNAWIQSPCFNLSNLSNPLIGFKVFWETEGLFDGANLQYSTDNGATWSVIGFKNEPGDCLAERWYNGGPLVTLNNQDGWQGNIQSSRPPCFVSGGSASWVTAKHTLPAVGGQPTVMFRFVFGSSSSCNDFDGFAIDDFSIEEAPPSLASFRYNCSSNLRVNFINTSTLCPTRFEWDFGDPASGDNNTSTLPDPTHAYTAGGNYNVSLTVSGAGNTSSTFTLHKLEIIENMTASIVTPVRCYDDTTGAATVNFVGDSSGISFVWDTDPVQTTRTAVHLGAGDYNVTILNKEGCPASAHISLGEPPRMLFDLSTVKPNCGTNNGSIDIAMHGGLPPYTYSWAPAVSTTASARNVPSGAYIVTVKDNNQCYKTINVALPDLTDLAAAITTVKGVSCFGGNDGIASASVTGGNMPYTYSWLPNNSKAATNNSLPGGDCALTVTDANGCKAIATATMPQPAALNSVMKTQHTFCGQNNGSATVEAYGGSTPYQYTWSTGNNTTAAVSDLPPGLHSVVIHDKNGCIKNDTALILPSSAILLQLTHTNVLCAGGQTGAAEARVNGGTAPYTYRWTSATQIFDSSAITGVPAGTYHLQLDDAVGCSVSETFVIEQPEPLKIAITTNPSYCNFNDGSTTADVTGGTSPYRFNWTPDNNTSASLTNIYAGNYELTVTDNNNCTASILATVPNNNPPEVFLGEDTTLCPGGKITLSPGIYSRYKWQDNSSSSNFSVTKGGTYSIEVTDDLGCVLKDSIKIIEDCGYIFFPNAFTPNNDLQNDLFGPLGVLSTVKDFTLLVYNRSGQLVFRSTDPFMKWNGKMWDNSMIPGTYVWIATYSNKGIKNIMQKGTVTVIR